MAADIREFGRLRLCMLMHAGIRWRVSRVTQPAGQIGESGPPQSTDVVKGSGCGTFFNAVFLHLTPIQLGSSGGQTHDEAPAFGFISLVTGIAVVGLGKGFDDRQAQTCSLRRPSSRRVTAVELGEEPEDELRRHSRTVVAYTELDEVADSFSLDVHGRFAVLEGVGQVVVQDAGVQILSPQPFLQVADLRECRFLGAVFHSPAIATEASWEQVECRRHRDGQKNTSRPARSRARGTAGSLQGAVFLRQQRSGLSGRGFRQPGITDDPKSQLVRVGTVAERSLGADPVDPSALNSHERSCSRAVRVSVLTGKS